MRNSMETSTTNLKQLATASVFDLVSRTSRIRRMASPLAWPKASNFVRQPAARHLIELQSASLVAPLLCECLTICHLLRRLCLRHAATHLFRTLDRLGARFQRVYLVAIYLLLLTSGLKSSLLTGIVAGILYCATTYIVLRSINPICDRDRDHICFQGVSIAID